MPTYNITVGDRVVKTTVINTQAQLDQSLKELLSTISKNTGDFKRVVGLDIVKDFKVDSVTNKITEKVALVKLCYAKNALIIQLLNMREAPLPLSKFLQLQELTFVSVGMKHCLEALERDYGIKCRNAVDLGELAASKKENGMFRAYGLVDLVDKVCVLGVDVKKMLSTCSAAALTSWGAPTLSQQQVQAAACRAFMCFYLGNHLLGGYMSSEPSRPSYDYDYDCY